MESFDSLSTKAEHEPFLSPPFITFYEGAPQSLDTAGGPLRPGTRTFSPRDDSTYCVCEPTVLTMSGEGR